MTHEEKLEEAKRLYQTANADQRYVLESLFPELKESEDEKIRKALIRHIAKISTEIPVGALHRINGVDIPDILAWIEKQGEKAGIEGIMENEGKIYLEIDGFDAELNALLKKYEHLPKKELMEPLEFYLAVLRDTLDIMKWTEEDELMMKSILVDIEYARRDHEDAWEAHYDTEVCWLKSLKKRMEGQ